MTFDNDHKRNVPRRNLLRRRPISLITRRIESENQQTDDPIKDIPSTLPVLPLRDVSVFNYMIVPLLIGRENSARAVEAAAHAVLLLEDAGDGQHDVGE